MKNFPVYEYCIQFSSISLKWNQNRPDASLKLITCMITRYFTYKFQTSPLSEILDPALDLNILH